jgi:CubicO group peptidase (beta-lactamase class C family)
MGLLGVLLAGREKTRYEELLIEHVAAPCGMDDTRVNLSNKQRQRLAPPYDAALQAAKNWDVPALTGAVGIRSTTNDMLKFVAANLANDDKPLTKAARLSHQKRHTMPDGQAIGLAWHIAPDGVTRWHNGMTGGYASWVSVVPSRNLGVVVLSNTAAEQITEIGKNITRIVLGDKVKPPNAPPVVQVAREVLEKYEGVYAITPQFALTVTLEEDKLMVQATGQHKFRVYPTSETEFSYKVVDAQLTFVPNKKGKAGRLILHQNGIDQVAIRRD